MFTENNYTIHSLGSFNLASFAVVYTQLACRSQITITPLQCEHLQFYCWTFNVYFIPHNVGLYYACIELDD